MSQVDIYTKGHCPYCHRAKALLTQKQVKFNEIEIDVNPELRDVMIERANGGYTVPQIFIDNQHIGGCDDLFALEAKKELDALLA
ncbi:glutaredoxin 3 [Paraglaciecola aquimarina]|uniref:Glutaredoxin n=1 Tax=Paraglaciecola aquimarina TaxID=1235557 RepID=A0ABU3T1W4_9ALTE|nr:glutaredoxin 3 [Paraglaciecola aquimarina]MDU0356260.1 glutaredoxin 3 [Paraglaciecola aquimarina]